MDGIACAADASFFGKTWQNSRHVIARRNLAQFPTERGQSRARQLLKQKTPSVN